MVSSRSVNEPQITMISGRCLLFDSVIVFTLVLRYTMTKLRNAGLATVLPLDHNIYIHKVVGWTILALAWTHTLMHCCTFSNKMKVSLM